MVRTECAKRDCNPCPKSYGNHLADSRADIDEGAFTDTRYLSVRNGYPHHYAYTHADKRRFAGSGQAGCRGVSSAQ